MQRRRKHEKLMTGILGRRSLYRSRSHRTADPSIVVAQWIDFVATRHSSDHMSLSRIVLVQIVLGKHFRRYSGRVRGLPHLPP